MSKYFFVDFLLCRVDLIVSYIIDRSGHWEKLLGESGKTFLLSILVSDYATLWISVIRPQV